MTTKLNAALRLQATEVDAARPSSTLPKQMTKKQLEELKKSGSMGVGKPVNTKSRDEKWKRMQKR